MIEKIVSCLANEWKARPFSSTAATRVQLIYIDHVLAQPQFNQFDRYAKRFAALGIEFRWLPFSILAEGSPVPRADSIFVQSPYMPTADELETVLAELRRVNPDASISYFDWFAPLDIRMAERVDPYVDFYVKKALFRDRQRYLEPLVGHTNLTDYFASNYGTSNPPADWKVPASILPKLVVGPAFSTGSSFIERFERASPYFERRRNIDIHARVETSGTPWYSFMRRQAAEAANRLSGFNMALHGRVSKRRYLHELAQSKVVFSPFGYGEICLRDFEAVAMGAVLIKPNMDHVETWPDIYRNDETYVSVRWDFSDLELQVRRILDAPAERNAMALRAFQAVHARLVDDSLERWTLKLTRQQSRK